MVKCVHTLDILVEYCSMINSSMYMRIIMGNWFDRNFGIIVTTTFSLAGVLVAIIIAYISYQLYREAAYATKVYLGVYDSYVVEECDDIYIGDIPFEVCDDVTKYPALVEISWSDTGIVERKKYNIRKSRWLSLKQDKGYVE